MTKPGISRRQAWCKLAVLIADGLPDPQEIGFNEIADNKIFNINVETVEALHAWARALNCEVDVPTLQGGRLQHHAKGYSSWHGLTAHVWAYTKAEPAPVGEDMAAVRAIAGETSSVGAST